MIRAKIITIAGEVAAGKSELTASLTRLLPNWQILHIGRQFKAYAESQGLGSVKVSHLPNEVHRAFDERVLAEMQAAERLIVEGRMAGVLARGIPGVFSVLLYAPVATRASRYRGKTPDITGEDAVHEVQYRDVRDRAKQRQVYGLRDPRDQDLYHLQINTAFFSPDEAAQLVVASARVLNVDAPLARPEPSH
jgi:cytidylate kinase